MYTSYIGKKFLKLYNEREGTDFSAEQFFIEILFPVFFDSDKHLMHVHGSTFFQSISDEKVKESGTEPLARLKRLRDDISNGKISGSTYVGYAAGEFTAVTSGQVTTMDYEIKDEEMYLSWIGQGLAIGLRGGLLFIDDDKIFWLLFEGWNLYRKHQNQTPNLKPRQIETWNGQWLAFCSQFPSFDLIDEDRFQIAIDSEEKEGGVKSIATAPWVKIVFALSKIFGNRTFTAQAFVSSKTNTTYGFVNIYLHEIRKMYELRDSLFFDGESILKEEEIDTLTTFYSFREACKIGTIGLKAIEPDQLRDYMPKPFGQDKEFKIKTEESIKQYQLFKIWIIAMLNKTELLVSARKIAEIMVEIEKLPAESDRGLTKSSQSNKNFLSSKNLKEFVEGLTEMLGSKVSNDALKIAVEEAIKMPSDLFPLFMALIKFEYSYLKK
jgi:hypothetical protein